VQVVAEPLALARPERPGQRERAPALASAQVSVLALARVSVLALALVSARALARVSAQPQRPAGRFSSAQEFST
jgi:hypothetical protein